MTGVIRRLMKDKYYGFIRADADGQDRFFHASSLRDGKLFTELREGDRVKFEDDLGEKGPRAAQIDMA